MHISLETKYTLGRFQWLRDLTAWDFGFSPAQIVGSNLPSMNVCLLWVVCVDRQRFLGRADHLSKEVLHSVVCECDREASIMRFWSTTGCCTMKMEKYFGLCKCSGYQFYANLNTRRSVITANHILNLSWITNLRANIITQKKCCSFISRRPAY